jgi:hypothetical protein
MIPNKATMPKAIHTDLPWIEGRRTPAYWTITSEMKDEEPQVEIQSLHPTINPA